MVKRRTRIGHGTAWDERTRFSADIYPATYFANWFSSAVTLQSGSKAFEAAILLYADHVDPRWRTFFDPSEPVTWCNLINASKDGWPPLQAHDAQLSAFVLAHRPFFYEPTADGAWTPRRAYAEALWGHILASVDHWHEHKGIDAWATGRIMAKHLREAGLEPPPWGPEAT